MEYLELVQLFQLASNNLKPITEFRIIAEWEMQQLKNGKYPAVFWETNSFVTVSTNQKVYRCAIIILDRNVESISGETLTDFRVVKTLTKCEMIVHNLFALVRKDFPTLRFDANYTMIPLLEYSKDNTYGYRVEFDVKLPFTSQYCELPVYSEDPIETTFNC